MDEWGTENTIFISGSVHGTLYNTYRYFYIPIFNLQKITDNSLKSG